MARNSNGARYASGSDASYIKPRFVPDFQLQGRDDSGGPDWDPYTAQWQDGGYVTGDKKHLSASGGADDDEVLDEVSSHPRTRAAFSAEPRAKKANPAAPAKSVRLSKET